MLDVRPVLLVIGILLITLGAAMIVPALVDLAADNTDWMVFAGSSAVTLAIGVGLTLTNWGTARTLRLKQAFVLTAASWVVLALFAAIPLRLSGLELSFADAFFESMSGLTTTGSTVIVGLDSAPPGLLLWRALLQWLGGVGIIVMAVGILPLLQVGGMQLFKVEAFDTPDKVLPSAAKFAGSITLVYIVLTAICALAYWFCDMTPFDAVAHSMTTISTGGYSTHDDSIGHFDSTLIDWITVVFMILGSLPFALYLRLIQGRPGLLFRNTQVVTFLGIVASLVAIITAYQLLMEIEGFFSAVRDAAFNVVSLMTGTGFTTADYDTWGHFSVVAFFWLMFIGGCSGSTSCGIKVFRFQVVYAAVVAQIRRTINPHGVFIARYDRRALPESVISSVMSFFFLFFGSVFALAVALGLLGLDDLTAMSAAGTAIANVGPGLGPVIGPSGNFSSLPDTAKWLLAFGMLLGRLELFTVLVILTPGFWHD